MRRVCKPGGLVAVRDSDYLGFTWFPETPAFDEWMRLYQEAALANGGEPQAGRRLLSWARAAGFTDITPSSSTWCFANPQDRQYWGGMWADRKEPAQLSRQPHLDGHLHLIRGHLASQRRTHLLRALRDLLQPASGRVRRHHIRRARVHRDQIRARRLEQHLRPVIQRQTHKIRHGRPLA